MTPRIHFFAEGLPKGQPRPKAFSRGGIASVYDPGTAEGWKAQVAVASRPHLPKLPLDGNLSVTLEFHMPRPKGHYRTGKNAGELRESAPTYHIQKPDADNLAKAVLDALTLLKMWGDDSQVCVLKVYKYWNDQRQAGCEIFIEEAPE